MINNVYSKFKGITLIGNAPERRCILVSEYNEFTKGLLYTTELFVLNGTERTFWEDAKTHRLLAVSFSLQEGLTVVSVRRLQCRLFKCSMGQSW